MFDTSFLGLNSTLEFLAGGTVPHAGFGLGFERAILYATGIEDIREVIPFPRAPRQADF